MDEHTLPHGVFIAFFVYNYDDVHDLAAEVKFWIGGKMQVVTKSFVAYMPAGTMHCPLNIHKIWMPVFHVSAGQGASYF